MALIFLLLLLLGVFVLCLAANAGVAGLTRDDVVRRRVAVLGTPFLPGAVTFLWIYPGLLPWNAAGLIMFYPVLHILFVFISGLSLMALERLK